MKDNKEISEIQLYRINVNLNSLWIPFCYYSKSSLKFNIVTNDNIAHKKVLKFSTLKKLVNKSHN